MNRQITLVMVLMFSFIQPAAAEDANPAKVLAKSEKLGLPSMPKIDMSWEAYDYWLTTQESCLKNWLSRRKRSSNLSKWGSAAAVSALGLGIASVGHIFATQSKSGTSYWVADFSMLAFLAGYSVVAISNFVDPGHPHDFCPYE